jgi:ESX secretion-associated protein EspG
VGLPSSVVLSALEFDVVWESERFPHRNLALDVPSPGITHTQRAELVARAWAGLERRGLAVRSRAVPELADRLSLLAHPQRSVDVFVRTDRQVRGLAAVSGRQAQLAVVDRDEVWLIPARDSSFVEAAVSVAGECPAGYGRSVSVPQSVLHTADEKSGGDPKGLIVQLEDQGVPLHEAQLLSGMVTGMSVRGQFGVEQQGGRDRRMVRADRIVAFHDTDSGRYLYTVRRSPDGQQWATITPADSARIAASVWELFDEL